MKISTKTRYGMRLMIDLAQHWGEGRVALKDIAKRQGISKKYLEQVVTPLVSSGLLRVTRGHLGGYELSRGPQDITAADIVSATEDGLILLECMNGFTCEREGECLAQGVWNGLENALRTYLQAITLQDVIDGPAEACLHVACAREQDPAMPPC